MFVFDLLQEKKRNEPHIRLLSQFYLVVFEVSLGFILLQSLELLNYRVLMQFQLISESDKCLIYLPFVSQL
jgi:hypothetical protein